MNKPWPSDGSPAHFTEICDPIIEALRFAYTFRRRNRDKDIPWKGLDIGEREKVSCFLPDEALSAEALAYALDDQGRDAMREILAVAIQLGSEQGRRIEATSLPRQLEQLADRVQQLRTP